MPCEEESDQLAGETWSFPTLALRPWNPRVNQEGGGPEGSLPGVMIHDLLSPLTLSCPLMTHIPVSLWGSAHLHNILQWEYWFPQFPPDASVMTHLALPFLLLKAKFLTWPSRLSFYHPDLQPYLFHPQFHPSPLLSLNLFSDPTVPSFPKSSIYNLAPRNFPPQSFGVSPAATWGHQT